MNQPTEDRFKRLEEEQRQLKEEMRQLREQITEPIKITRLEIDTGSMHKKLDKVEENTNITKIQMEGTRADILRIGESQADLRDRLIEHSEDLKVIKDKQEAHSEVLGQIVNLSEDHTKRFDTVDAKLDLILKLLQSRGE